MSVGAPITEFVFEQMLKLGLEEIRNHPSKLSTIYENLNVGIFADAYGKAVIKEVRDYIMTRKISIVQNLNLIPTSCPCFSIAVVASEDDHQRASFDDFDSYEMSDIEPTVLSEFVISDYDAESGFCSVEDDVNLDNVYIGAVVKDSANATFEVIGPIVETTGGKGFGIVTDAGITVGAVQILSQIDEEKVGIRQVPMNDKIQIGIHVHENPAIVRCLYYLLVYFLFSRRLELEALGYMNMKFMASDLIKDPEFLPDHIITRFLTISCLTFFKWKDEPWTATRLMTTKLKVDRDIWIKDDDTAIATTTPDDD